MVPFTIDDYTAWRLLEGLDDIGLTLRKLDEIETFEASRPAWKPHHFARSLIPIKIGEIGGFERRSAP